MRGDRAVEEKRAERKGWTQGEESRWMKSSRLEDMDGIKGRHVGRKEVTGIPNIPVVCSHLPSGSRDSCYYGMENIQPQKGWV